MTAAVVLAAASSVLFAVAVVSGQPGLLAVALVVLAVAVLAYALDPNRGGEWS